MDDMGWCPLKNCGQLAHIDKSKNQGRCTFCDLIFCLDCNERSHPFKRCKIHRLDLLESFKSTDDYLRIIKTNQASEDALNKLFMKHCTKPCPNPKCGVPIIKIESGCTHI